MEENSAPEKGKKKLKEYLLEGLMIFVAVSMGFIAENLREYIGQTKQEAEYVKSLINDLKLDTTYLSKSNLVKMEAEQSATDLLNYFKENPDAENIPTALLFKIDISNQLLIFIGHTGAIERLKNSGSLRLIKNKALVDSIEAYYQQNKRVDHLNSLLLNNQDYARKLKQKMINAKDIIGIFDSLIVNRPINNQTNYISLEEEFINEYINQLVFTYRLSLSIKKYIKV
ncbi:MAG: hypothetical protein ING84_16395 [Cytophagales bacterium]|nr:hypothetical protein [Cytophagales bacterium]MCA6365814.1 hypothetical protein [Cytophagales bacterium]MCA6371210.1 hypothetical protein [Cytophagales bacterium]MCA6375023.1 hypothetical protein [Cytophagales bacterium]MCA6382668.1 hypothetical protein [Cytophagales bacterium]